MSELIKIGDFPWQPQSYITGNLAVGNLRENLLRRLRTERGVHAETLMVAIGVLTGFAAQNAALEQAAMVNAQNHVLPKYSLMIAGPANGQYYMIGEWINIHLLNDPGSKFSLYGFAAGTCVKNGVKIESLTPYSEMVKHVTKTLGTAEFGKLCAPANHHPGVQPQELLKLLWPFAREVLRLPLPENIKKTGHEPPLSEMHWPIICSYVAAQFMASVKDGLEPGIAYSLIMESAIIAGKIFPELIEPKKWKLEISKGELRVTRLKAA